MDVHPMPIPCQSYSRSTHAAPGRRKPCVEFIGVAILLSAIAQSLPCAGANLRGLALLT
jgi:hypothetical protein